MRTEELSDTVFTTARKLSVQSIKATPDGGHNEGVGCGGIWLPIMNELEAGHLKAFLGQGKGNFGKYKCPGVARSLKFNLIIQ